MYRNYDGNKSTFGDTSVAAATPNPDTVSAFAAPSGPDGALTVMVINKQLSTSTDRDDQPVDVRSSRQRRKSGSSRRPTRSLTSPTSAVSGTSFVATLPAQSITLFVVPGRVASGPPGAPTNLRIIR